MKTNKNPILISVSLALFLFTFYSCQKDTIDEPSPLGPSSIATTLTLNASPNVIFAGLVNRQTTEVTASLMRYDGAPLSDKTVFFEVVDSAGNRMNLGYFDGNLAMQSIVTDGSGNAQTHYHGPLTEEIADNGYLYIRATVAWEGSQLIADTAPLYVVRDSDEIVLKAEAIPDLIYASEKRDHSEIRATLTAGGKPVAGIPVYFVIVRDGQYIGRFSDGKRQTMALTNNRGVASITYVGPLWVEIPATGALVNISVEVTQGLSEQLQVKIIRQN